VTAQRVLVTGSTGFIGRHLVQALADAGHEVISISRTAEGPTGASLHLTADFTQPPDLPALGHVDAVVHLVGIGDVQIAARDPARVAQVNAQGTLHALQLARTYDAQLVFASSQRVYRPSVAPLTEDSPALPTEAYGYTKLAAELYVAMMGQLFGVPGSILRLFSVYGPGQVATSSISGVVAIFGARALAGHPLQIMSSTPRDLIDIADAVQGIERALLQPTTPPRAYNIGSGMPTSLLTLAHAIKAAASSSSSIVESYTDLTTGGVVADITRARQELGFAPQVSIEKGLQRYVEWLRSTRAHSA
jgi:UDP-glucose 4-epimerase